MSDIGVWGTLSRTLVLQQLSTSYSLHYVIQRVVTLGKHKKHNKNKLWFHSLCLLLFVHIVSVVSLKIVLFHHVPIIFHFLIFPYLVISFHMFQFCEFWRIRTKMWFQSFRSYIFFAGTNTICTG